MNYFKHYKQVMTNILPNFFLLCESIYMLSNFCRKSFFLTNKLYALLSGWAEWKTSHQWRMRIKVWISGKLWLHLDLSFQQNCIKVILVIAVGMALSSFLSKISSFQNHISLINFVLCFKNIQLLSNSQYQNNAISQNATSCGHRS